MQRASARAACALMLALCLAATACEAKNKHRRPAHAHAHGQGQAPQCARTCHEIACDQAALRYGKYCGVGHGGCPGEEPCDDADACCREHDDCVGRHKAGVLADSCHADFLACLEKVQLSGSKGFSKTCPYSLVIPTMRNGIELTMAMSQAFGGLLGGLGGLQVQVGDS